ncbi:MAG TPA: COX15/CtaA family protein [Mycobacteriales bacterium]|jgi:cytochrome c oxidase assembly protein subunit 15|nr:COX15/CtaA family protein [Mycobacteriales bacterium]
MRASISATTFRRLTVAVALSLAAIVITGAAVRLTSSGLGCPTWPRCTDTSLVAPASYHALVEFTNRIVTTLVGVLVFGVAFGALLRAPRRRDLTRLSWSLVGGFMGQAVIGGLSVLYHLAPPWVMAHFLLSMALLWVALVLVQHADPAWESRQPDVQRELVLLARLLVGVAAIVLFLGTFTTGTGPHAGSGQHIKRLHVLPLERITQLHADSALLLTGLVIATLFAVRLTPTTALIRRRASILAGLVLLQVAIGYTQYFLNLPPSVVELHVAGATALWCGTIWLQLSFTAPVVEPAAETVTQGETAAANARRTDSLRLPQTTPSGT